MKDDDSRIENLLVVILLNSLKGASMAEKASQLSLAGFSNVEIADFLKTSPQVIANALSAKRKKKTKSKRKREA